MNTSVKPNQFINVGILTFSLFAATIAVTSAFSIPNATPDQKVVISAKKMTDAEKAAYDLAQVKDKQVVLVAAKRMTAEEKQNFDIQVAAHTRAIQRGKLVTM